MKPLDLISSARLLINSDKGKPSQVNLRRSLSSAYYAMFHCLARTSADLLVGGPSAEKSKHAWQQVYRAVEHSATKNACKDKIIRDFPKPIEDFANTFVTMQTKRHSADYDPFFTLVKSEVLHDIDTIESAIKYSRARQLKISALFVHLYYLKKEARRAVAGAFGLCGGWLAGWLYACRQASVQIFYIIYKFPFASCQLVAPINAGIHPS